MTTAPPPFRVVEACA